MLRPTARTEAPSPKGVRTVRDGTTARRRLAARKDALQQALAALRQNDLGQSQGEGISELSTYDNHPGDLGTEMWRREQQVGYGQDLARDLALVDEAEAALKQGRYGVCGRCGRRIPPARLAARPEALTCVSCQEKVELEAQARLPARPVEQEPLAPLMARQDQRGATGFDQEDAWLAVAMYGSSDTPSDQPGSAYPDIMPNPRERRGAVADVDVEELAGPD